MHSRHWEISIFSKGGMKNGSFRGLDNSWFVKLPGKQKLWRGWRWSDELPNIDSELDWSTWRVERALLTNPNKLYRRLVSWEIANSPVLSRGSSGGKVLSENRWDDGSGILTRIRNGEEFSQGISRLPISIPLSAQPTKSRPRSSSRGQSTGYFLG